MRAEVLRNLGDCLGRKFREQFVGETCEVLLEDANPLSGRCERYFVVSIKWKGQTLEKNQIVEVRIMGNVENVAVGEVNGKH
jgi:tRNA A37 methylthiotransferase MiaB